MFVTTSRRPRAWVIGRHRTRKMRLVAVQAFPTLLLPGASGRALDREGSAETDGVFQDEATLLGRVDFF